jgi:hypothetical protein
LALGTTNDEKSRIQFPPMTTLKNLAYEDLPKFTKIEFGTGTHIRCLKFYTSDGQSSEKTGTFNLDNTADLTDKDIGKIER